MKHTAWVLLAVTVLSLESPASAGHIVQTPVVNGTSTGDAGVIHEDSDDFDNYSGSNWISGAVINPNSTTSPPNPLLDLIPSMWRIDGSPALVNDGKLLPGEGFNHTVAVGDYKHALTNFRLGFRNRLNLTAAGMANAQVVHGGTPTCVNGTDENPLIFKFRMNLGAKKDNVYFHKLNVFAELTCGDDRAPTSVSELDEDDYCYNNNGVALTRYTLNMSGDGQMHRSIAAGQIAWVDQDPCFDPDPEVTNPTSKSYRLTLYDGQAWHQLYNWPASGVNIHTCGDYNRVTLYIKSTTIDVELKSLYNGSDCTAPDFVTYTTTVPRQYLGPFTAIKMGGLHDEIHGGVWGQDKVVPDHDGTPRAYPEQGTAMDNVDLYGGEAFDTSGPCDESGACCTGHSCQQLTPTACAAIEGAIFQGGNTVCWVGAGMCCASPAVDFDFDTDVDMNDFARLQRCLNIGQEAQATPLNECACFDVDGTPGIDTQDVEKFVLCSSGANVPASVTCLD